MENRKLGVLGVCNGQGLGLYPFTRVGKEYFEILGNIEPRSEYFSPYNEQWKLNWGKLPLWRRKEDIKLSQKVDIIIGNPKCGGSSVLRLSRSKSFKSEKEIKSEPTLNLFIDCVNDYNPEIFLMENLPKLLSVIPKKEFSEIFKDYILIFHEGPVSNFGNSQKSRIRLVIIGIKKNSKIVNQNYFGIISKVRDISHTRYLINNLENNITGHIIEDIDKKMSMYDYRDSEKKTLTVKQIHDLWVNDFKDELKWPIKTKSMRTLPGVYRNKNSKYPMTARKSERQFREDGWPMSPRELARIQGIPDAFKIYINENKKQYWINKGRLIVTQTHPYEIGLWFKQHIIKTLKKKGYIKP